MALPQEAVTLEDGTVEQWTILTALQFIDVCAGKLVNEYDFKRFYYSHHRSPFPRVTLKQLIVKEPIEFSIDFKSSFAIEIAGGLFQSMFRVSGGEFQRVLMISGGEFQNQITISGGKFQQWVYISGGEFQDQVKISGGEFNSLFVISGGEFNRLFHISGGLFQSLFKISGGIFKWPIEVSGGLFQSMFRVSGGEFRGLFQISNGEFRNRFRISGGRFQKQFVISGGEFQKWLKVSNSEFQSLFKISGGTFLDNVTFSNTIVDKINVSNVSFGKALSFQSGYFCNIILGDNGFKELNFMESEHIRLIIGSVSFKQSTATIANLTKGTFNELIFENAVAGKDTIIQLNDLAVNRLVFNNHNNLGYISFNNLKAIQERYKGQFAPKKDGQHEVQILNSIPYTVEEPLFRIIHSSIGKTEFVGCDLASFDRFEFENSNLLGAFFAGKKMPKELTVSKEKEKTDAGFKSRQQQFGYGQLKEIFQKQGDKMQATEYYALEMQAYRETLKDKWYNNSTEKATLWFNKWSNNYGTSWWRALKFTLIVTVVAYTIYCLCLGQFFNPTSAGWDNFRLNIFPGFFEFFLLTHKMDFMTTHGVAHINGWAMLVDILGRIGIGYGIYQFVQAFRKHGKK